MSDHEAEWQRLRELLVKAVRNQFDSVGLQTRELESSQASDRDVQDVAGLIAFSNDRLRGTMVFRAPYRVPEQSHPMATSGPLGADDVQDWMGELTNGLPGRFKNLCASNGLDISIGIPRVLVGTGMGQLSGALSAVVHFECNQMPVEVSIDVVLDTSVALFGASCEQVSEEGALLLF